MMKRKKMVVCTMLLAAAGVLFAASPAEELETLSAASRVSCSLAARFILDAAGLAQGGESALTGEDTAFAYAKGRGWLPADAASADPIDLGQAALLTMRAFDLKGGLLYSLFHTGRHAAREMAARRLVQGNTDPDHLLTGAELLQMLGRTLSAAGKDAATGGGGVLNDAYPPSHPLLGPPARRRAGLRRGLRPDAQPVAHAEKHRRG